MHYTIYQDIIETLVGLGVIKTSHLLLSIHGLGVVCILLSNWLYVFGMGYW